MKENLRIVFFGTPEFAVESLKSTINKGYYVVAVVTAPDKPSGRGLKLKPPPVKEFAIQLGIQVLQPANLKDPGFISQLKSFDPDLQVVVAFRMLPREVWGMPRLGTFNLHASLLPQYRGAAPINWVLINGEQETGVTTFFLEDAVDTGNIAFTDKTEIAFNETAGELHDRLMVMGAELVVRTLEEVESESVRRIPQAELLDPSKPLKKAPKLFREDCRLDWNLDAISIHNRIRGLSPYPGAYGDLRDRAKKSWQMKVFRAEPEITETGMNPGEYLTDGKTWMKVVVRDGFILLREVRPNGHRTMAIPDFLNGFGRYFI